MNTQKTFVILGLLSGVVTCVSGLWLARELD